MANNKKKQTKQEKLYDAALDYHTKPQPGKISMKPTTPLETQVDLSLAYSPGVAAPCLEIEKDPLKATRLHITRQCGCGYFKRYSRFGSGQYWCPRVQTCHGRKSGSI